MKQSSIKSPSDCLMSIRSKLSDNDICAFISGFLFFIIIHFFTYTNTLFVHDSVFLYDDSMGIANGRFCVAFLFQFIARMNLPWIIGLIASCLAGLIMMFLVRELKITNKMSIILLSGLFAGYPSVIGYHVFFGSVFIYLFAILITILSVSLVDKKPILSAVLMLISLGCYQAFIGLFLSLCVIKIIFKLDDDSYTFKQAFKDGIKYIIVACVSMIAYYLIWKGLMFITNTAALEYRGYNNLESSIFSNVFTHIFSTITITIITLFKNYFQLPIIGCIAFLVINTLGFLLTLISAKLHKKPFVGLLLTCLLFTMSVIYMLNPGQAPHLLMLFPSISVTLLFVKNMDNMILKQKCVTRKNVMSWFLLIICAVLIWQFAIVANTVYLKEKTRYDNSISYATRLIDRLEETDGFTMDVPIVIVGSHEPEEYNVYPQSDWSTHITKVYSDNNSATTYPLTLKAFLEQELNMNLNWILDDGQYAENDLVKNLEPFPAKNCTVWIDGMLIIKVSK